MSKGHDPDGGDLYDRRFLLEAAPYVVAFKKDGESCACDSRVHHFLQPRAFLCVGLAISGHDATSQDLFYNASVEVC